MTYRRIRPKAEKVVKFENHFHVLIKTKRLKKQRYNSLEKLNPATLFSDLPDVAQTPVDFARSHYHDADEGGEHQSRLQDVCHENGLDAADRRVEHADNGYQ